MCIKGAIVSAEIQKNISGKYEKRFGQTAVAMGFISEERLKEALRRQAEEDRSGQVHRLLGAILFDMEWMTSDQIEQVMNTILKNMRMEEASRGDAQAG